MMLLSGSYRVVLVTTHLAVREVAGTITEDRVLGIIELTNSSLRKHFGLEEPRIGVCALNPHGGEDGIFGDEETRVISPAVSRALEEGIRAQGPLPSDTLFTKWREFDAIVAMYHDQGLIPLKLLGFGKGVNLTLGLPFVRTSPDHGTAFDIAGKGVADPGSMTEALRLAAELCKHA
jgi:4-hydroxythreonine-4-phosphate dehydrogenase